MRGRLDAKVWLVHRRHVMRHDLRDGMMGEAELDRPTTPRCGDALPIHFFTIVLNGEPFIRYHEEVFRRLTMPWHWHVIEGVALLRHDTAWSLAGGGHIPADFHDRGRSRDGTSAYLDE